MLNVLQYRSLLCYNQLYIVVAVRVYKLILGVWNKDTGTELELTLSVHYEPFLLNALLSLSDLVSKVLVRFCKAYSTQISTLV